MHRVLVCLSVAVATHSGLSALSSSAADVIMPSSPSAVHNHYRTPNSQRNQRPLRLTDSSTDMSPSLSSLSAIRAQLQQLNLRIKSPPGHTVPRTDTAIPPLSTCLSPIPPLTPATPYCALSPASFSSPVGSINSTLPPDTDTSTSQSTASASRSASPASHCELRTDGSVTANRSTPATPHSLHSHSPPALSPHHDIYQLADSSTVRWRQQATEAQRSSQLLRVQCAQLQDELTAERRRRERQERQAAVERERWEGREAEEERAQVDRCRTMADLRRDVASMRVQVKESRQQVEAELRVEYEDIVAAVMKEKDDMEEAAGQYQLAAQQRTDALQQTIEQLRAQVQSSEALVEQSRARLSDSEAAMRAMSLQSQQHSATVQLGGQLQQSEWQRMAGTLLTLLPSLCQQYHQRMADLEQRLVRVHTAVQLATSKAHAQQRVIVQLTLQHTADTELLQRTVASMSQHTLHHQQHVQQLTAEHDAYCAILRAQLADDRSRAEKAVGQLEDERAARRLDGDKWERVEVRAATRAGVGERLLSQRAGHADWRDRAARERQGGAERHCQSAQPAVGLSSADCTQHVHPRRARLSSYGVAAARLRHGGSDGGHARVGVQHER